MPIGIDGYSPHLVVIWVIVSGAGALDDPTLKKKPCQALHVLSIRATQTDSVLYGWIPSLLPEQSYQYQARRRRKEEVVWLNVTDDQISKVWEDIPRVWEDIPRGILKYTSITSRNTFSEHQKCYTEENLMLKIAPKSLWNLPHLCPHWAPNSKIFRYGTPEEIMTSDFNVAGPYPVTSSTVKLFQLNRFRHHWVLRVQRMPGKLRFSTRNKPC